jgi:alpha-ketoglutarate-dependent taurine dioxygenase
MTMADKLSLEHVSLKPFGRVVTARNDGADLRDIAPSVLEEWTVASKVLVLRGFPLLPTEELVAYAKSWGEVLMWNFGAVLDLVVEEDPKNYLFSRGDAPFHWDGAFAHADPRFFMFQCPKAPQPGGGGETVFSDVTEVLRRAGDDLVARWAATEITYRTEKLRHYGGDITRPLLAKHSVTGETTMRYNEPLDPEKYLNPLEVIVKGMSEEDSKPFLVDLRDRLHDPEVCYAHEWRDGDIVVVDNEALLHGRNAFRGNSSRHLQRVQIL